jgi:glycosyltransferase involved in cell wall biosynthesis
MARNNTVSAVIPTRNRPHLVLRAVKSALTQTYGEMEVIVVIDGPDAATEEVLRGVSDPRLKVIALDQPVGAARARNVAVESAQGDWIAFLDDDDEWLPEKTQLQMERVRSSAFQYPIACSQVVARSSRYEVVWPRKAPSEPLSEYLLARNSWSYGEGLLATIVLLAPKDLLESHPFRADLRRHQDWDWILRAAKVRGAGIEFVPRPLAIWHQAEGRKSISTTADWRISFEWAEGARDLMTDRAYAGFLATQVAPQAARQGDWKALPFLLKAMVLQGAPKMRDLALFFAMWSVPTNFRAFARKAGR